MFLPPVTLLVALIPVLLAQPVSAAVTAFRFSDLHLRDPHLFVSFIGCRDFTDTQLAGYSFNGQLQTHIQTDGDGDGKLDENFVLVFDPVDPSASTSQLIYESALSCRLRSRRPPATATPASRFPSPSRSRRAARVSRLWRARRGRTRPRSRRARRRVSSRRRSRSRWRSGESPCH